MDQARYRNKKKKLDLSSPVEKFGATDLTEAVEERKALAVEIDDLKKTLLEFDHGALSNREVLRRLTRAVIGLQRSVQVLERAYLMKELEND